MLGNGRCFSVRVEKRLGKGETACYEQFLLFPQCFQETCTADRKKKIRACLGKGSAPLFQEHDSSFIAYMEEKVQESYKTYTFVLRSRCNKPPTWTDGQATRMDSIYMTFIPPNTSANSSKFYQLLHLQQYQLQHTQTRAVVDKILLPEQVF